MRTQHCPPPLRASPPPASRPSGCVRPGGSLGSYKQLWRLLGSPPRWEWGSRARTRFREEVGRLASDSWTCPCFANSTASTSPFRNIREHARPHPARTAPTLWRMASSTRRRNISRTTTPSRMGGSGALRGTCRCLSPRSPAATGFWSPSRRGISADRPLLPQDTLSALAPPPKKAPLLLHRGQSSGSRGQCYQFNLENPRGSLSQWLECLP